MNITTLMLLLFTAFTAFGMIAPPLVMNKCLIPVAAGVEHPSAHARMRLAVSPKCQQEAHRIIFGISRV